MRAHELVTEYSMMAGGIQSYLQQRGYRFLGAGVDQQAYLEPGTGHVLKVFGTDCSGDQLSEDQEMFRTFAEYCARHQQNPHLPRIYGYETFMFPTRRATDQGTMTEQKCLYLQIRTERLRHVSNQLFPVYEAMSQAAESDTDWNEFVEDMDNEDVYDGSRRFRQMTTDAQSLARMHRLYETMRDLATIGKKQGYGWDLHGNNIMERSDGTPVITDPWIVSL